MNSKSFTLIELLVVISILGLLAGIIITTLQGANDQADQKKAMEASHTVRVSLGADLLGEWTFDDGTARDSSGNENNGIIHGAVAVDGIIEGRGAMKFTGSANDHIITANILEIPQEYTLSVWIKGNLGDQIAENIYPFGWCGKVELTVSSGSSARGGILIRNAANTGYHSAWDGTNVLDGKFHFWATSVDRTTGDVYIYLDGEEIYYEAVSDHYSTPGQICIGAWTSTYGNFTGIVDEARIYSRALSSAEIQQHYVRGMKKYNIVLK